MGFDPSLRFLANNWTLGLESTTREQYIKASLGCDPPDLRWMQHGGHVNLDCGDRA